MKKHDYMYRRFFPVVENFENTDINNFNYIIDRIKSEKIIEYPFPHLDIKNILKKEHLDIILNDKQIHFGEKKSHDEVYNELTQNDWEIQTFPGCTADWKSYKEYITKGNYKSNDPVENIGITFRLHKYRNNVVNNLIKFMNSDKFHKTLREKFNITKDTKIISAIQKNLSGYEISPHPDIRQKSLTYLININNNTEIEKLDCNTHLLKFKPEYKYIEQFWKDNEHINRCWVPWDWCDTVKTMKDNNSMIIFKPDNSPPTLHAIKLNYNHLKYQRTQIYGNLMFSSPPNPKENNYKDLIR